jgi:hypothetical protein
MARAVVDPTLATKRTAPPGSFPGNQDTAEVRLLQDTAEVEHSLPRAGTSYSFRLGCIPIHEQQHLHELRFPSAFEPAILIDAATAA